MVLRQEPITVLTCSVTYRLQWQHSSDTSRHSWRSWISFLVWLEYFWFGRVGCDFAFVRARIKWSNIVIYKLKMSSKTVSKDFTKDEELLLQDFSRNVSTKSSALFYGNAFIVSAIPICKSFITNTSLLVTKCYLLNLYFVLSYFIHNSFGNLVKIFKILR